MSNLQSNNQYIYDDIIWDVLPNELDQDKQIMDKLFALKDKCFEHSSRLFALRMDFRLNSYTGDNTPITRFHQQLIPALRDKYPKSFISFAWVREQDESDAQHYHYVLIMNDHHVRYAQPLVDLMSQLWAEANGGTYWLPKNPWYLVGRNDAESQASLMKRISYLGKKRTKEHTPTGIKRFETGIRLPKRITGKIGLAKTAMSPPMGPELQIADSVSSTDKKPQKNSFSLPKQINRSGSIPNLVSKKLVKQDAQLPRAIFWARHRDAFRQQHERFGITVDRYISVNKLQGKTAARHLKKREISSFWNKHVERYYYFYWPLNTSVELYCKLHKLKASTARQYLARFTTKNNL